MPTVQVPVDSGDLTQGTQEMEEKILGHFAARLIADRDRHSTNATSFEKLMELDYARTNTFRDANAARIVMEAGSGRTRGETNNPGNTGAPNIDAAKVV